MPLAHISFRDHPRSLHEIRVPLYDVVVELLIEGAPAHGVPSVCLPSGIQLRRWTPVEGASNDIPALFRVKRSISARLHDVNFSTERSLSFSFESKLHDAPARRPDTISVIHGKHPNCGPKPVAFRDRQQRPRRNEIRKRLDCTLLESWP